MEDCVNSLDRSGLWHGMIHSLFYAFEEDIRSYFMPTAASNLDEQMKDKANTAILENGEVLFLWNIIRDRLDYGDAK